MRESLKTFVKPCYGSNGDLVFVRTNVHWKRLRPTLPSGWELVATADFNGGGNRDYVLYNPAPGKQRYGI